LKKYNLFTIVAMSHGGFVVEHGSDGFQRGIQTPRSSFSYLPDALKFIEKNIENNKVTVGS
jgi:hypothetical protein